MSKKDFLIISAIFIFSLSIFSIGIGKVHLFDWDEINFAESAREMIVTNDFLTVQVDFKPFWEKPPFFIWLQVFSMKIFGVNEFAARFPNALFGAITLIVLFLIGKKLKNRIFGLLWTAVYFSSVLTFFYAKSGIIDPIFNLFIFLGLYFFINYLNSPKKIQNTILAGFFIGMAVLTKGPVGFLLFFLSIAIFFIIKKFKINIKISHIVLFLIVFAFVGGFWFILQILSGNYNIIVDFILYQIDLFSNKVAGHGGFLLYHFVVLFIGLFPAIIFALPELIRFKHTSETKMDFALWMKILFWIVLILFTIVKTKIVHYSSMCYLPATYIAALVVYQLLFEDFKLRKIYKVLLVIDALILGFAVVSLPLFVKFQHIFIQNNLIKDKVVIDALKAQANWSWFIYVIGLIVVSGTIYAVMCLNKNLRNRAIYTILAVSAFFTISTMFFTVSNIEKYSQNSVIEFYKQHNEDKEHIAILGFKSYAHLFYTNKMPQKNLYQLDSLVNGKTDKPVLFVVKINKLDTYLETYPNLELTYQKNGFAFLKRKKY